MHIHNIDSVQSAEVFASGAVAMMVNWIGFADVAEGRRKKLRYSTPSYFREKDL
jgi:hypothetical protein